MKIPAAPERGHVIRYAYLWADERDRGQQEGLKDRPTLVVAISILEQTKLARVLVVAIAHTPPRDSSDAVLRSADIARRLGLNHESSWIVTTEANGFVWPAPDTGKRPD